mgnify:CR=1 FL=1
MIYRKRYSIPYRAMAIFVAIVLVFALTGCDKKAKRVTAETEEITFGIDVAKYQGTIDWDAVEGSGIDFAMIRLGYRAMADGMIVEDSNARYNLQEAGRVGIPVGAYFFSTAVSHEEAEAEAAWVAALVSQYPITYPIVYDCEGYSEPDSRQYHLSKAERTDIALVFLETIEKLGYEGMFYASKNELHKDAGWEVSRIEDDYKIWVAQYPEQPYPVTTASSYTGKHHMWQYSMEGTVAGISQPVDLDIAYFGYDGIEPAKNTEPPEEAFPDPTALMNFREVSETVTAKEETRLRSIPSQDEDSQILFLLKNGETAQRIAVSDSGWSRLLYQNTVCYAVSSYLTTNMNYVPGQEEDPDGIQTQFSAVDEQVTAKEVVNLRMLPSVEHEDADVIAQLKKGDVARRIGISDNGWSKLEYNGTVCYAVTSYLTTDLEYRTPDENGDGGLKTQFATVSQKVTPKIEVNLRKLPSVTNPDATVMATAKAGEVFTRIGISQEHGWSRVEYQGQTLYCVSSYIEIVE